MTIEEHTARLESCMYQYSRAIYRSIKDLIDPYSDPETQLESRRAVLSACEQTMERLATDPMYFAKPDRALFLRNVGSVTPSSAAPVRGSSGALASTSSNSVCWVCWKSFPAWAALPRATVARQARSSGHDSERGDHPAHA